MDSPVPGTQPILCAHLLREVDHALLELLRSLEPHEWDLQTVTPLWRVREVAAHLLDTPLRKLSLVRDGFSSDQVAIRSPQDVIDLVNRLNLEGVTVYRRLSPAVLLGLLETVCAESADFHESLDPFARAAFNVSWAGEEESLNWFDSARELTERWHHQQQIRLAARRPGLFAPRIAYPVFDCFMRGLPHALRNAHADAGSTLVIEIAGAGGGIWAIERGPTGWSFCPVPSRASARVSLPQEIAWRVFTKGIARDAARPEMRVEGNDALGEQVLRLTAIVG